MKFKISKDAVAIVFSIHRWGNRKTADKRKLEGKMDKRMLNATKRLLDSQEYKAIGTHLGETKQWIISRSVPSFFHEGIYLFNKNLIHEVEEYLALRKQQLSVLINNFLEVYPQKIEEAKELLKDQYQPKDYPSVGYLRYAFSISHRWVEFDIPEGLPKEIYEVEKAKVEKMWQEAAEQITMSLRESFQQLISHAVERLTPEKGKKPKIIKDSVIENINDFIDAFKMRNLTNDILLEELTEKARKVLTNVDGQDLRDERFTRLAVKKEFAKIEKALGDMIVEKPSRKFNFDE